MECKEFMSLYLDLFSRGLLVTTNGKVPVVSYRSLCNIVFGNTGVVLSDVHSITQKEWKESREHRYHTNQILLYFFKHISKNPNPKGPRFSQIISASKSAIDIHHTNTVTDYIRPSQLVTYSTKVMFSQLKRGGCMALWRCDHIVLTMYEEKNVKEIPAWLMSYSR